MRVETPPSESSEIVRPQEASALTGHVSRDRAEATSEYSEGGCPATATRGITAETPAETRVTRGRKHRGFGLPRVVPRGGSAAVSAAGACKPSELQGRLRNAAGVP